LPVSLFHPESPSISGCVGPARDLQEPGSRQKIRRLNFDDARSKGYLYFAHSDRCLTNRQNALSPLARLRDANAAIRRLGIESDRRPA
jgi:hypothetical protein